MKRLMLMVVMGLITLIQTRAQQSTIYFKNLSQEIGIGLGYSNDTQQQMFGIVQYTKKSEIEDFSIKFTLHDGRELPTHILFTTDTIIHWTADKVKIHEIHYLLSTRDMARLRAAVSSSEYVIINSHEFASKEVLAMLDDLVEFQYGWKKPLQPNENGFAIRRPRGPIFTRMPRPFFRAMWHR